MRFLALGVFSFCLATPGLWAQGDPLTVDQIVQLIKEGVSESIVIEKLRQDGCACRAGAMEIMILRGADASDELIREVIAASSRGVRRPEAAPRTDPAPDPALQEFPRLEAGGGVNWFRVEGGESFWGWQIEGQVNANRWVGGFVEFSQQLGDVDISGIVNGFDPSDFGVPKLDVNLTHLHAGPKATFRTDAATGFVRGGLGFSRASLSHSAFGVRVSVSETGFSWLAGAGLDVNVAPHVAIRVIQADYAGVRVSTFLGTETFHNFRLGFGVVFKGR